MNESLDLGPKSKDTPDLSQQTEDSFEKIKEEFSNWSDVFIVNLYQAEEFKLTGGFEDPVQTKINDLLNTKDGYLTKEQAELSQVFIEKLVKFSNDDIFSEDFSKEKRREFFTRLSRQFFSHTGNLLEYINVDFPKKVLVASEVGETYFLNKVIDSNGEISYDLSFCNKETVDSLVESARDLPISQKLSVLRQLSQSARRAFGSGTWAYPAFKNVVEVVQRVKEENDDNQMISFFIDFELMKIRTFAEASGDFEGKEEFWNQEEKFNYADFKKMKLDILTESEDFFNKNEIIPPLDDVMYSRVSKDYGSILPDNNFVPFALVKHTRVEDKDSKTVSFSRKEITLIENFISELEKKEEINDQLYVDVTSMVDYLNHKDSKFIESLDGDLLDKVFKIRTQLGALEQNINERKNKVRLKIEDENYNKTKEVFNYINENFDAVFSGKFKQKGGEWLKYKEENYEDGMFDVMQFIGQYYLFNKDKENLNKQQFKVVSMGSKLSDFHIQNWQSLEEKQIEATKELEEKYSSAINDLVGLAKNLPIDEILDIARMALETHSGNREVLPIKSYEGLTKSKDLNPLGDEDFSHLVKVMHSPEIRNYINKRLGIKIEELALREQIYFLRFLSESSKDDFKKLEDCLKGRDKSYNQAFFKSFLSMSGDFSMGDKILSLGEKLPQDVAEKVFAKYGEIIATADDTQKILESILPNEVVNKAQDEINNIRVSLLVRAKNLLSVFYDKKDYTKEALLKDLERYKTGVLLFADLYKNMKNSGVEISLEDIKNTEIDVLTQEEKQQIASELWDITIANRPFITEPDKVESRRLEFFNSIENEKSDFYVLKHNDEIVAFCSFTPDEAGNLRAESLNMELETKGSGMGSEFFPIVISRVKNTERGIYGYVHEKNKMTLPYYQRIGFEVEEVEKDGELKYKITIPVGVAQKAA